MGTRNRNLDLEGNDYQAWMSDFDDEDFEDESEKSGRGQARRKTRAARSVRNRFSDYEGERWLKRHVADWEDYDAFDDDDLDISYRNYEIDD